MKMDRAMPWIVALIVGAAMMATGALFLSDAMRRPPVRFEAVSVAQADGRHVVVLAEVRRSDGRCTNGLQADLRNGDAITRLPPPVRTENSHGLAFYRTALPNLSPGRYQVQIRELSFCPDVRVSQAPWLTFSVQP